MKNDKDRMLAESFETWWRLLPTSAYPEEEKELFRNAYYMGWMGHETFLELESLKPPREF